MTLPVDLALLVILVLLLLGMDRTKRFSRRRRQRDRDGTVGRVLSIVAVAGLVLQVASFPGIDRIPGIAPLLAALTILAVWAIVQNRSMAETFMTGIGLLFLVSTVGVVGAIQIGLVALVLVWLWGLFAGHAGKKL